MKTMGLLWRNEFIPDIVKHSKAVEEIKDELDNEEIMLLSAYRDDLLRLILKYHFPGRARKASSGVSDTAGDSR